MKAILTSNRFGPLILGSTGRLGRMLARVWPDDGRKPLWQRRPSSESNDPSEMIWDILGQPAPDLRYPVSGIIVLAGVVGSDPVVLGDNTRLALAACELAEREGIERVLIATSQAVYGRATGALTEDVIPNPDTPYGKAKLAMERAVSEHAGVTCLRIGNVVGADAISGAMATGPVTLDQFADGRGPRRMMIGPVDLAKVLVQLLAAPERLPKILNVASPGLVGMSDILDAAGATWEWVPAPSGTLAELEMDVSALGRFAQARPRSALDLVQQARAAGWSEKT